jgi:hypothetical protein
MTATRHPEALPQYRTCAGACARSLLISSDNFALRRGPGRYPWQPSAYAPRCKLCQPAHLKALREATKANRYAKEIERQRKAYAAGKLSQGMTPEALRSFRAHEKAREVERLAKAARVAEIRRTLRADLHYDPAQDLFKRMIRARQEHYAAAQPPSRRALQDSREHRGGRGRAGLPRAA